MGQAQAVFPQGVTREEERFLLALIRRFDGGVTEGHLHMLIYSGQKLGVLPTRYDFQFQHLVPFSDALDLGIAMLLWNQSLKIQDNRLWEVRGSHPRGTAGEPVAGDSASASLDNLLGLSYDALKLLAVMLHWTQDENKSRQEAISTATRLFPIREEQALKLLESC